jgi:pSer/pThr/pTyr-binding forkhead associated (FHA) protein
MVCARNVTTFQCLSLSSTVVFRNSRVSKTHLRIYSVIYDEDHMNEFPPLIYCEDRDSTNGTWVNDTLIGRRDSPRSPYLLNDGDVITMGPQFRFRFRQMAPAREIELDEVQTQELEVFSSNKTLVFFSDVV